jgi:hypothetical protein
MRMSLKDWLDDGWLHEHDSSIEEISDLMKIAQRDISDCKVTSISADRRFMTAYNAILQLATAVLAASGYRAARDAHHYRVIQSLGYTINADKKLIHMVDRFRQKCNICDYTRFG